MPCLLTCRISLRETPGVTEKPPGLNLPRETLYRIPIKVFVTCLFDYFYVERVHTIRIYSRYCSLKGWRGRDARRLLCQLKNDSQAMNSNDTRAVTCSKLNGSFLKSYIWRKLFYTSTTGMITQLPNSPPKGIVSFLLVLSHELIEYGKGSRFQWDFESGSLYLKWG